MSDVGPSEATGTEIAIVGMSGRFPGADTVAAFWNNVRNGVESIRPLTDAELEAAGVPASLLGNPDYVKSCAVLDGFDTFDAPFFGFSPKDAAIMDPQHRVFLECAWEALEAAGHAPDRFEGPIGVYAGCGMNGYMMFNLLGNRKLMDSVGMFLVRHTGNDKDFLATRVSYELDLRGPSVNVQTACSTSLVAIHLAAQSLLNGECDMALAGGVTIDLPHGQGYLFKEGEILSPDGHCRAFAAESQGTVFGSGAGVVVLRRLADALRDGDHVHAVLRGSAINNDGAGKVGYLAPSVDGQAAAIGEALAVAGVDPATVTYVEAHGTGTPVGDPIEVAALTQAFRTGTDARGFCALGSLKTNIGHLDTAAGVAGFIKTVKALEHGEIPPSLHFDAPNPVIDFQSSPFYVNAALAEWKRRDGVPRRAGVSSLGVGGTNAHVVLEEAPAPAPSSPSRGWQLLPLSARTTAAADAVAARLAGHLREHPGANLADVAFTLQVGRQALRERRLVVCRDTADAVAALESGDPRRVVVGTGGDGARSVSFLFAGGGAQHPGMGRDLYDTEPVFRAEVDRCLALVQPRLLFDLRAVLYPDADGMAAAAEQMERPSVALPALFVTQYAMARLWMSWGVSPTAMIGHSMGEYTAAHLAGVFSLGDALALVALRGRLFERVPPGGMLSVPLTEEELQPLLGSELSLAAVNAPGLCVASGPVDALDALQARLAEQEVDSRRVRISVAAHSAMLAPILREFEEFFRTVTLHAPTLPFVSNLSGGWITPAEATDPGYWVRHIRHTVRYADGIRTLLDDPDRVLLEVGPGRTLASITRQQLPKGRTVVTSMRHPDEDEPDVAFALGALGRLWMADVPVDWAGFYAAERRRRVPLPTYPFERQRHWIDATPLATVESTDEVDGDARQPLSDWFWTPQWKRAPLPASSATASTASTSTASTSTEDGARATTAPVLLFREPGTLGTALATRLRAEGRRVVEVVAGDGCERRSGDEYAVHPTSADDHGALLAALAAAGDLPAHVVHLWNVAEGSTDTAFHALLALAQALGREDVSTPLTVDVVSTGLQQVAGETAVEPVKALLLGPCRVIPREFPNVACRSIDVAPVAAGSAAEARLVDQLAAEIAATSTDETVALRGRERWVQEFAPLRVDGGRTRVRDGGTYLVTGGLGGIGLVVAEGLARGAAVRLVLVGRRAPDAAQARAVAALEALGAQVMTAAADVADVDAMTRVVREARQRFGRIDGVVHAAGVLDDGLIAGKTAEAAARVLRPKVEGTLVLDHALGDEPLDFFVLFSSVSSSAGIAGQVDYAAANAFLDAFAQRRSDRDGTFAVAVDWSAWQQVGMAAALGGAGRTPGHPLLERCVADGAGESVYATRMGAATHWLLDQHRLGGGEALIPGTGYLELARAALEERPENRAVELRDVFFLAPLVVRGAEERELQVRLKRGGGGQFSITSRPADGEGWHEHVQGSASYVDPQPPRTHRLAELAARCNAGEKVYLGLEPRKHLRFGPRWDNLRRVRFGHGEALATLELPEEFAGDLEQLRLHPAVMDMATAGAQALIPGFEPGEHFYVPVSYTRLRAHGALPRRVFSHIRLRPAGEYGGDVAAFDVTLMDENGVELVEVEEFVMKRVEEADLAPASSPPAAAASSVDVATPVIPGLEEAIRPEEGVEAFLRILAADVPAQVVVSPHPLPAAIRRMRAPPAPPRGAEGEAESVLDVSAVEAALAGHEAIREAAVMAYGGRAGEVNVVACVVWDPAQEATVSELRRFLRTVVAEELVPAGFVELDALPRTSAGDVDRRALPNPFAAADDHVAPTTPLQMAIAEVWGEVLGIDRVSIHDNFFDVGGHSLLAMRAITRIARKTGVRLNNAMMVLQTLEQLASEGERQLGTVETADAAPAAEVAPSPDSLGRKFFNAIRQTVRQG